MQAACVQRAQNAHDNEEALMMPYAPSPEAKARDPNVVMSEVNMYEKFHTLYAKLSGETPLGKWEKEEQNKFNRSYKNVRDSVIKEVKRIVTTINTLGGPYIQRCNHPRLVGATVEGEKRHKRIGTLKDQWKE